MGIPDGSRIATKKFKVWARSTVSTAATGNTDLSILCNPFAALTNDVNVLAIATPTTPGQLNADMSSGGILCNSPYAAGNFTGSSLSGRLVSAQLRVRYAGTELNRGGTVLGLQEPTHSPLTNSTTATILAHTSAKWVNVVSDPGWFTLEYKPADTADMFFIDTITRSSASAATFKSDSNTVADEAKPFMGAYITCPTISTPYQYEFWAVVEFAGFNVPGKTINPPDIQGVACVLSGIAQIDERGDRNSFPITALGAKGTMAYAQLAGPVRNNNKIYDENAKQIGSHYDDAYRAASSFFSTAAPMALTYGLNAARNYIQYRRQAPQIMDLD